MIILVVLLIGHSRSFQNLLLQFFVCLPLLLQLFSKLQDYYCEIKAYDLSRRRSERTNKIHPQKHSTTRMFTFNFLFFIKLKLEMIVLVVNAF